MVRFGIICIPRSVHGEVANMKLAEDVGFDLIGAADSQSLYREVYVMMALIAKATKRVRIGTTVSNPITRHPAVTASAICAIDEASDGRALLGLGSGDSAILNLGERPANLAAMRKYVQTVRALMERKEVDYNGKLIRCTWPERPVPIYVAAEGPKTLEMTGELCDGVILNSGNTPELLQDAIARVHAGAQKAGRDPSSIDIWTFLRINITDNVEKGLDEIKMELASNAHHVFRFTFEGKHVPDELVDDIRKVQAGYVTAKHEHVGGPNAHLIDQYPALLKYLAERFAVVGPADYCAERIRGIAKAGVSNILFSGLVEDRAHLIRVLGEKVLPLVN